MTPDQASEIVSMLRVVTVTLLFIAGGVAWLVGKSNLK